MAEPTDRPGLFAPRVAWSLALFGTASFALGLGYILFGERLGGVSSVGADSFSRSALGHSAFVRLLNEMSIPTRIGRFDSAGRAKDHAALIVIEPPPRAAKPGLAEGTGGTAGTDGRREDGSLEDDGRPSLRELLRAEAPVLVVLPKWSPRVEQTEFGDRLVGVTALEPEQVASVLAELGVAGATIRRLPPPEARRMGTELASNLGHGSPQIELDHPQLAGGWNADSLLFSMHGEFLFRLDEHGPGGHPRYVLTDPDLIANHGLGRAHNAELAVKVIEQVTDGRSGPVLIDETLHGHGHTGAFWGALVELPLLCATVTASLLLIAVVLRGAQRFGAPLPLPPPIAAGKGFLIEHTAALLRLRKHDAALLGDYWRDRLRAVGRSLHAPATLSDEALVRWLDRGASSASTEPKLSAESLQAAVAAVGGSGARASLRALAVARRIHAWQADRRGLAPTGRVPPSPS